MMPLTDQGCKSRECSTIDVNLPHEFSDISRHHITFAMVIESEDDVKTLITLNNAFYIEVCNCVLSLIWGAAP